MYNQLGKDEIVISMLLFIFAIIYRTSEECQPNIIPIEIVLLILLISTSYLFFNRIVKLLINYMKNKDNFYDASAFIQSTKYIPAGKGSYICYFIKYEDKSHNFHIKELHSFFSIKNLKIGDEIKIKVDHNNPDNIILPFSDLAIAIIMGIIGIIFESILISVYICTH